MASLLIGLMLLREHTLSSLATDEATVEWQEWRDAAKTAADGGGPVQRRQPTTTEPPAVVLMRDNFGVCIAAVFVFGIAAFRDHGGRAARSIFSERRTAGKVRG